MIRRVRKDRRRTFSSIRHEAASHFVLFDENRNPYRPGSKQFIVYETEYLDISSQFKPRKKLAH